MASGVVRLFILLTATHMSDALLSCVERRSVNVFAGYIVAPGCHQDDISALESLLHLELTDDSCDASDGLLDFGGKCNGIIADLREFSREDTLNVICDAGYIRYGSEEECNNGVDVLNLAIENVLLSATANDPYPDLDRDKPKPSRHQKQRNTKKNKNAAVLSGKNNNNNANNKNIDADDDDASSPKPTTLATHHVGGGGGGGVSTLSFRGLFTAHHRSTSWSLAVVGIGVAFVLSVLMLIIVAAKKILKVHGGAGIRRSTYIKEKDDLGIADSHNYYDDALESDINNGNQPPRDSRRPSTSVSSAAPSPVRYRHHDWCTELDVLQARAHIYGVTPRSPSSSPVSLHVRPPTSHTMPPPPRRHHHSRGESPDCLSDSDFDHSLLHY